MGLQVEAQSLGLEALVLRAFSFRAQGFSVEWLCPKPYVPKP